VILTLLISITHIQTFSSIYILFKLVVFTFMEALIFYTKVHAQIYSEHFVQGFNSNGGAFNIRVSGFALFNSFIFS